MATERIDSASYFSDSELADHHVAATGVDVTHLARSIHDSWAIVKLLGTLLARLPP